MDDPIKVIHKYKNNNNRIQYHIYIFIGDILDDMCIKILTKISNLDFYNTLITITPTEHKILIKTYGEYWYEKFFNTHHINFIKESTLQNPIRMTDIGKIYDKKWINTHFIDYKPQLRGIEYSYGSKIKDFYERKMIKKLTQQNVLIQEELPDYTTSDTQSRIINKKKKDPYAGWCDGESSESDSVDYGTESDIESDTESGNSESESTYSFDTDADDEIYSVDESDSASDTESTDDKQSGGAQKAKKIESDAITQDTDGDAEDVIFDPDEDAEVLNFEDIVNKDLEEADIFFQELDDIDKNIKNTTKEIKDVISNEVYDKLGKKILEFDTSKDNSMFDSDLKDVYEKKYVTYQYIYKDDIIKTIKSKICCAIKNNPKFGENTYIIPSQQYLWSEYLLDGKIDKVMIGHKWIVKNNVLKLDVEPNTNLRVYEELRGNLKILRDNIRRQGKIKPENDDNNILHDYNNFYTSNELYMIDILNEFGLNYDPPFEDLRNVSEVYIKIYFPKIRPEDITNIISFLKKDTLENKKNAERSKYKMIYETANNSLILDNTIMRNIELVKKQNPPELKTIFKDNHIIQSVIRAYITERYKKIDLFRIFDNFELGIDYPFIQYQPTDSTPRIRFNEKYLMEHGKKDLVMKWFENSSYGISFKMKVNGKKEYEYMTINLSDNGKIDYKIQWKEEESHTIEHTIETYKYVRKLIEKINIENGKFGIKLHIPKDSEFNFAFINTIQKIVLPEKFVINHNDLSDFSRCFFPYISLIIDPRKRQAKIKKEDDIKSKFGTYLRFKRISDYENKTKIEHRILFFIRNYEYNDQSLANEISKEFNLTLEQAIIEINLTREKYPNVKKSRKVLKKLENIPKYKPPGIGVDIQGKQRDNYKMRIAGARDKEQLDKILEFMHAFFYLYIETYLYKRPSRQQMKDHLKRLTKVAKRINKVDEFVDYEQEKKSVKQVIAIDKDRLGYKADEKVNSWPRECQNSGTDKKRRPKQFLNASELLEQGYVWNEKLNEFKHGHYEKKIMVDEDGSISSKKKKHDVTLRAIQLALDDTGTNYVYYVCGPEENGKQMYVGFLGKKGSETSSVPCCFIKDQFYSVNATKRNLYLKSIGLVGTSADIEKENELIGDQLYILQDTNKIYENRLSFLPRYLDIFMNLLLDNKKNIRNHYLLDTESYYFKFGVKKSDHKYLNAVGTVIDLTVDEIKQKIIKALETDRSKSIFTSLNNGDIRTRFGDSGKFISYINSSTYLEYELLNDLLCTPGVLQKHGINIIIFQKKIRVIKKVLEKERIKESYHILCQNSENTDQLLNPLRQTLFLLKDGKSYYPIVKIKKKNELSKNIDIEKVFTYADNTTNIINHTYSYYKLNCQSEFSILVKGITNGTHIAKNTYKILTSLNKKEFQPKTQFIDARSKCRFIITHNGYIIPTIPSGSIYNLPLIYKLDNYIKDYDLTVNYLTELTKISGSKTNIKSEFNSDRIDVLPIGIYYEEKNKDNYIVTAIMTKSIDAVPIQKKPLSKEYIQKNKLLTQNRPNDDIIDNEISKGNTNKIIDYRTYDVAKNKYDLELYQLFRLHLSYYLNNTPIGLKYKTKIENIVKNPNKFPKRKNKTEIKRILYTICSKNLLKLFNELIQKVKENIKTDINIKGGEAESFPSHLDPELESLDTDSHSNISIGITSSEIKPISDSNSNSNLPKDKKWLHILPNQYEIDYVSFEVKNNRELCYNNTDKYMCGTYQYCHWNGSKSTCSFSVKNDLLIDFINKISEEFIQNGLKSNEIMQQDNYVVSDIVSYNIFTEREGERIIIGSHTNIQNILEEIFGKDSIPKIGKRRTRLYTSQNYEQINEDHPMRSITNWYIQNIIENNNTIFRAFSNTYYWLMHPFTDIFYRNLGYYSKLQTELSNIYKSHIVEWLLNENDSDGKANNEKKINKIKPYVKYGKIEEFVIALGNDVVNLTSCIVELYVLSILYGVLIYIYNENYDVIYVFHPIDGFIYNYTENKTPFDMSKYYKYKKNISMLFKYISKNVYPDVIESMYPKE